MPKWILTPNDQILDSDLMNSYWIELVPSNEYHIFCQDMFGVDWRIAEFKNKVDAQEYLIGVFYELEDD